VAQVLESFGCRADEQGQLPAGKPWPRNSPALPQSGIGRVNDYLVWPAPRSAAGHIRHPGCAAAAFSGMIVRRSTRSGWQLIPTIGAVLW